MFLKVKSLFSRLQAAPIKALGFYLLFYVNVHAQQPASFLLGENQFRGIQIYDIIQDNNLNYWFATNEGIYCFNGVIYEKVECAKAKSNSAFNFVKASNGTIYCHNLNNQVFKLSNKKLTLFYELTEQEGSADISLAIDKENNLLINSRQVLVLDEKGKFKQRKIIQHYYIGPPFISPYGAVYYHLKNSDSVLVYEHGKFRFDRIHFQEKNSALGVLKFYKSYGNYFAVDLTYKLLYQIDPKTLTLHQLNESKVLNRSESVRIYETKQGIWIASTLPGVNRVMKDGTTSINPFFNDYFISDVYEDRAGNILLGTFDKGVLVIPDLKIPDVLFNFQDDPAISLHSTKNNTLLIGTSKGKIYSYANRELKCVHNSGKRPIEIMANSPSGKWLIFDDGGIRARNNNTNKMVNLIEASLKAVVFIDENRFYLGTNLGVFYGVIHGETITISALPQLQYRVHFLDYDKQHNLLYVATSMGLMVFTSTHKTALLQIKGMDIYPNHLMVNQGYAYVSLKDGSIALFQGEKLIKKVRLGIKENNLSIKKIALFKNSYLANTSDGFLQFDLHGKLLHSISSLYGLSNKRVVDFAIQNDQIWVTHPGGLQQINTNYNLNNNSSLTVRIDKIYVNDQYIKSLQNIKLANNQRKIQFYFSSPTLNNRETIVYQYRLIGYDTTWSNLDFDARQVTYNALSSGSYTFQLRCKNNSTFSKVCTFHFTIATPLYARLWFILVVIVIFLGSVFYIYSYQLRKQRKKAEQINELNASKLTAIQSQMNPHFIFNSLNSIQDLILKQDVKNSYSYITTFSNLVRRTLSYSQKDFIDFEQEIKLLELYLSLEKLRFKTNFEYKIETNNIIEISIPPLLIQPFIENSLVHGLLHKDGDKKLLVEFVLEEKALLCKITDNGVGREEAKAIRIRQKGDHESFSSQAIQRRFEILSKLFGREYGFEYTDLMDGNQVAGTQVILKIPYKQKF